MKWVAYILCGCCVLVVSAVVFAGVAFYRYGNTTVPNAYAVWWVAGMVILHMDANDGDWPGGWGDLEDDFVVAAVQSGEPWTFESLRHRVEVDWDADPAVLVTANSNEDAPPFDVIRLRDGRRDHWGGREPNQMILDYLKQDPDYLGP